MIVTKFQLFLIRKLNLSNMQRLMKLKLLQQEDTETTNATVSSMGAKSKQACAPNTMTICYCHEY